jgi:hypothetical protein
MGGFGITLEADTFHPRRVIIFCLRCKAEGRRWILPEAKDCPHEWESGADRLTRWRKRRER